MFSQKNNYGDRMIMSTLINKHFIIWRKLWTRYVTLWKVSSYHDLIMFI